jgi:hypothetical protein
MKAKLHKMVSGYILSLNGDIDDPYAIVNEELAKDHEWYKLSIKNCQAIEHGYDLDELAKIEYPICEVWNDEEALIRELAFKKGFQKALEILGDKRFSEKDMSKAWSEGYHRKVDELNGNGLRYFDKFIQSLQQTEWDVEVVMDEEKEFIFDPAMGISQGHYLDKPKLDVNGCLILKRIK